MEFCSKCGTQLPDEAVFCYKCGARVISESQEQQAAASGSQPTFAIPASPTQLKCSSCGAPISPKFGEMVITCEYCGTSITLGNEGWKSIQKHTMLPLRVSSKDDILTRIHNVMDKGILRHHLQESSVLEEINLSFVPYWIIPVSARTSVVAVDEASQVGTIATTMALVSLMGGIGNQGGRGGFGMGGGMGMASGMMLGSMMGGGMGMGGMASRRNFQLDSNYDYPVVALAAFTEYQPIDYNFALADRMLFDIGKIDKSIKVLNGDISEDAAKYRAKALVDQLQSIKAHQQYHMIQQISSQEDVSDGELLHVPVWFVTYNHKGKKIVFVIDANTGNPINSIGL